MMDDNIYSVNLVVQNKFYKSIEDEITCPICAELKLDAKVTTCSKNCQFSVCGDCSKLMNNCPICREPTNWINCVIIRQLLPNLEFQCKRCGREVLFDRLKGHYENHEQNNTSIPEVGSRQEPGSPIGSSNQRTIAVNDRINERSETKSDNNTEKFNLCEFLKSDRFSKLINFYYIIFLYRTLCCLYFSFRINYYVYIFNFIVNCGRSFKNKRSFENFWKFDNCSYRS